MDLYVSYWGPRRTSRGDKGSALWTRKRTPSVRHAMSSYDPAVIAAAGLNPDEIAKAKATKVVAFARIGIRFNALSSAPDKYRPSEGCFCALLRRRSTPSLPDCWGGPEVIRRPSQRHFEDLAQAARSPACAAASDPATSDRATPAPPNAAAPDTAGTAGAATAAATAATNNDDG
jgi:hypothetical protein